MAFKQFINIALQLPLPALGALCRTNRAFSAICAEDWFWQRKVKKDFGEKVIKGVDDIKDKDLKDAIVQIDTLIMKVNDIISNLER